MQTHERLGAILGAHTSLEDAAQQMKDRAEQAEARVEQLEREVNEEWVTRGMPSWRSRAKRAEAAFAECKRRRECDRERIAEAEATIERLEWMLVEVDHGASIDDAASRWTPEEAAE
jgi:molecular chaperone GrpE (heat shock protein)